MKCPHLKYRFKFVCMSENVPYMPEIAHIRGFCRSEGHAKCPFHAGTISKIRLSGQPAEV